MKHNVPQDRVTTAPLLYAEAFLYRNENIAS